MREHDIDSVIIVSDPYHMARAAAIARELALNAQTSPTPTSRFNQSEKQWRLIADESLRLFAFHCWRLGEHLDAWWKQL